MNTGRAYVRVIAGYCEHDFSGCTADEFTKGELTVSGIANDEVMRVYPPGSWERATCYDGNGHPLCWFEGVRDASLATR